MQQGTSRTPCRRLGLKRVSSLARSNSSPTTYSPIMKSEDLSSKSNTSKNLCEPVQGTAKRHMEELLECPGISTKACQNLLNTKEITLNQTEERPCSPNNVREPQHIFPASKKHCANSSTFNPSQASSDSMLLKSVSVSDLNSLRKRVALKEKQVQQLCQTKIYQKKHDPDELMELVQQWLQGCQDALQELLSELNNHGNSIGMSELLKQLAIPPSLVNFDEDTNEFFDNRVF